jgi:hypothetical protein
MAEMVGLSRGIRRPHGVVGSLVAAVKLGLTRLTGGRHSTQLRLEEWPDYLLRDVGLDRRARPDIDPRGQDWLMR